MVRSDIKFTYEDYKNLPESETERYELLEGELVVVPSPNERHQSISGNLIRILSTFVRDNKLGRVYPAPFDVVFGETNVLQPDTMYISRDRLSVITRENVHGAPDLVVEILSPATATRDRAIKRAIYARHGVREMWLVDPEQETVEVARLEKGGLETIGSYKKGNILVSEVLPGLRLKVDDVFD
ncbi:MAG: Uma2 family endonuclease [Chloroflexi bacterium]|nr:Uma2 family endonuclease [Chloroflexota bacterium]